MEDDEMRMLTQDIPAEMLLPSDTEANAVAFADLVGVFPLDDESAEFRRLVDGLPVEQFDDVAQVVVHSVTDAHGALLAFRAVDVDGGDLITVRMPATLAVHFARQVLLSSAWRRALDAAEADQADG